MDEHDPAKAFVELETNSGSLYLQARLPDSHPDKFTIVPNDSMWREEPVEDNLWRSALGYGYFVLGVSTDADGRPLIAESYPSVEFLQANWKNRFLMDASKGYPVFVTESMKDEDDQIPLLKYLEHLSKGEVPIAKTDNFFWFFHDIDDTNHMKTWLQSGTLFFGHVGKAAQRALTLAQEIDPKVMESYKIEDESLFEEVIEIADSIDRFTGLGISYAERGRGELDRDFVNILKASMGEGVSEKKMRKELKLIKADNTEHLNSLNSKAIGEIALQVAA